MDKRKHRRWILTATILASSMGMMDGTVVNIALPALQATMGATIADVQWVVEAYTLFLAALMLTGGALGDRLGRKRIFLIGIVVFTAGCRGGAHGAGQPRDHQRDVSRR